MMRILLIFIYLFQTTGLWAEPSIPVEQIDSLFKTGHPSDSDWVISLRIDQAWTVPIYDSLSNRIYESPQGTFVLFKIGQGYFLQKLWTEYLDNSLTSKLVFGKRIKIDHNQKFNYNVDSLLLSDKEWIYPYVYKKDSVDVYNVQEPANHEPYYGMYFKAMQKDRQLKFFTETCLTEAKVFMPYKNLNYVYKTRTFIYRTFCQLLNLVKENMVAWGE